MTRSLLTALLITLAASPAFADDVMPNPMREQVVHTSDFKPPDEARIGADYLAHVAKSDKFTDAQKQAVAALGADEQAGAGKELITASLRTLYPDFDKAQRLLGRESTGAALKLLTGLAASDDPYLSAYARFYAARAHAMNEDYEKALPLLDTLTTDQLARTLHSGEAMFYKGVAQAETLDRDAAITTLKDFAANYPNESERMVIGALHLIDEMSYLQSGSLVDVQDRMDYSRRRLGIGEPGEQTQDEQTRIVAMIEKLIKEQEDKENQGGGQGAGQGQGQGFGQGGGPPAGDATNPNQGANQSAISPGQARIGELHRVIRGSENWGEAREKDREEVLNAIKARYPERYRELVEQYYRSLQDENR